MGHNLLVGINFTLGLILVGSHIGFGIFTIRAYAMEVSTVLGSLALIIVVFLVVKARKGRSNASSNPSGVAIGNPRPMSAPERKDSDTPGNSAAGSLPPAGMKSHQLGQTIPVPLGGQLGDGTYVVKYVDETAQMGCVLVAFQVTCGPSKGAMISLVLDSRLAKKAIEERNGCWTDWMSDEGDRKCADLYHARHQAHEDQFMVTVKDGQVRSILDPNDTWERIERQIIKGGDRPIGGFQQPAWEDLIALAIQHKVPLDVELGTKPDRQEQMIPSGWEDSSLVMKKAGGRKILKIRKDEICGLEVSEPGEGAKDYPATMDAFVVGLSGSPFEDLRVMALRLLEVMEVSPEDPNTWNFMQRLAQDSSPLVRGMVADECREWTPRERKTVSKVAYSMIESIPAVFNLLEGLTKDPVPEVRLKACYALGDHPGTQAGSLLEAMGRGDTAEEVRKAAMHALARVREFEKVRSEYETAVKEKAMKSTKKPLIATN